MLRSPDRPPGRRSSLRRILLMTASRDWHARVLSAALQRRGIGVNAMRLEDCAFDTGAPFGLRFGRLSGLPDGVLVRTVSAGSFEAVTRRLGILHALKRLNVPVWNHAVAIERCVDKSMTTFLLQRAGLPVPPSWTVEGLEAAHRIVEEQVLAGPLVLKPLFGSQGRGLMLIRAGADLPAPDEVGGVYYLQRFVGSVNPDFQDFRIFVIEGEAIAAMARRCPNWITNVKQGGRPVAFPLDRELSHLAAASAAAVGACFCGVDIVRGKEDVPYILEVNSMPAWSGLQSVAGIDIAAALAEAFCRAVRAESRARVA
jgi:tetrahydromethanopterin:alpha-L-glutamate ligase